ncbi:MAG: ParB/RepB/Spo0J family partition protein [Firmicutes bacterium]|nr:ParB/RepB/Spo0J family partition protein [Candidatus Fermentithermobacillaceae bacterium]
MIIGRKVQRCIGNLQRRCCVVAKRGLGKGIDALIPGAAIGDNEEIIEVLPQEIEANPYQPRQIFDDEKIQDLAASMKEHGVIQPLIVRRLGSRYQLVAGERRLRAAMMAGLEKVPVVVRDMTDREAMEISLVENLQREDLGPIEEAEAYQRLSDEFGLTQEQIAKRVGKSRPDVTNTLRLLKLEDEVKELINQGKISGSHGRALIGLEREEQLRLAKRIVTKGLSVRSVEEAVSAKGRKGDKKVQSAIRLKEAEEVLSSLLGSPVVVKKQGEKGSITISFYGMEDLERVVELIQGNLEG